MNCKICGLILLLSLATACTSPAWEQDQDVRAARGACGDLPNAEQYGCYERQAVDRLNPDICRLVGKWVDDACLQAVYEAAGDASICDRIYLPGVVLNCRAYYAQRLPKTPIVLTPAPEATPEHYSTATYTFTETPGPTPTSDLGYNCSMVERLPPESTEAQKIVQAFVEDFKAQWPTEYMAMETLWEVDRLGEYAVIQGMVTSDERDAIVVLQTPQGYRMVSRFIETGGVSSRYTIPEYFAEQLPNAPPELFYCLDVSRLVDNAPAQELDLDRKYDCSALEAIRVDSPEGQAISQTLLDFRRSGSSDLQVELDEVRSIVRLNEYLAVQTRFRVESQLEPPVLTLLEGSTGNYRVIGNFMGPTLTRRGFLREIYAEAPDVPPALLACLELDWFFPSPTPTPSGAASLALCRIGVSPEDR